MLTASRTSSAGAWALLAPTCLIAACTLVPLQVDLAARAPDLHGYGDSRMAVVTASPQARSRFAQGMDQAYAFNEVEAVRAFKAALADDPACALCAWGVAYQLGPNINDTARRDSPQALQYLRHARAHAQDAPLRDRELIEALALRYGEAGRSAGDAVLAAPVCGSGSGPRADPLDIAYAQRMRELADRHPDDPDVVALYAEAEMIATRVDWWDPATGRPGGRIGEVAARLEAALARHPGHAGLNHYLIHAVDAPGVSRRAEAAADRLAGLAPASPHLLHMPAHTYVRLGRYADASRVNQQALAADDALRGELERQGFSISKDWRGHDGHFLWYAALMEGRGDLALQTARTLAGRAATGKSDYSEYLRSLPVLTLARLERWEALLQEPLPAGDQGLASILGQSARGLALLRTGRVAQAADLLATVEPAVDRYAAAHASSDDPDPLLRSLAQTSRGQLRAEIALAQGRAAAALSAQAEALASAKDADEAEPPLLAAGSGLALGDLQLRAGNAAEAERTFRADLAAHPDSGWALRGLARAQQAQHQAEAATATRQRLAREWPAADHALLAMR